MAKVVKQTFISLIQREGSSGSVRGKIPASLVKAINAKEGDGVEFMVHGTTLVGAQVLSGRALKEAIREKAQEGSITKSVKLKKSKPETRKVVKSTKKTSNPAPVKKSGKKPKPIVKPSKRKTEVEYDVPKIHKGKKKKPLGIKLGKLKK